MATLIPVEINTEKELHGIIKDELDALENGLRLLKYEMPLGVGVPDFVCVDSGGRLVIIEVKLYEDENILFQALGYYSEIDRNRYVLAESFRDEKVDPKQSPRLVLIAKGYSEYVKRLSTLVKPVIELFEYTVVQISKGKNGIVFHPIPLPQTDEQLPPENYTPEQFRDYITDDSLKSLFDLFRNQIKEIDRSIVEYCTYTYVGYKYRGRQVAGLLPQRKSFDFWGTKIDDNCSVQTYDSIRIKTGQEDISSKIQNIKDSIRKINKKYEN